MSDNTQKTNGQILQQHQTAKEQIDQFVAGGASGVFNANNPNQRLFVPAFDGTSNDRNSSEPNNIRTNPDLLQDMIPDSNTVSSQYIPGVGTGKNPDGSVSDGHILDQWTDKLHELATGDGSKARAEFAYNQLVAQVQTWKAENPNAEIHVSSTSFSRGSVAQILFADMVAKLGVKAADGTELIPPGGVHQDLMLMYDPVITGQKDILAGKGIPDGARAISIQVTDESRISFDAFRIADLSNPNYLEVTVAGAHSDGGGGHDYTGLSALNLELGYSVLSAMGVPMNEIPAGNMFNPDTAIVHDPSSFVKPWNLANADREIYQQPSPEEIAKAQHEAEQWQEVQHSQALREAELDVSGSQLALENAVASGDTASIVEASLNLLAANQRRDELHGGDGNLSVAGSGMQAAASAIDFGQSLDDGDFSGSMQSGIRLVQDLDQYVDKASGGKGSLINNNVNTVLNGVGDALGLYGAINDGDALRIAGSTINLFNDINTFCTDPPKPGTFASSALDDAFGFDAGTTGTALAGAVSAVGLAMNIANMDDLFAHGNALEITHGLASTVNDAVNT